MIYIPEIEKLNKIKSEASRNGTRMQTNFLVFSRANSTNDEDS